MIKHLVILLVILNSVFNMTLFAQSPPEPTGRRLRDIVDDKYSDGSIIIGGTTGSWSFGENTGLIMDREFNYVTPENDFKQWAIHPGPDTWNWQRSDAWVDHICEHGQILRMHCPIGPQCCEWAQTDSRTAEELEGVMRDYMRKVCERYNGVEGIVSMDVVNEIVQNGTWKKDEQGTGGWELPWYKIGRDTDAKGTPLYIRYAFEIANEYAPDLKLILNHHEHPESAASWNLIKSTVAYLRNLGLRVDGIGWQAHVNNGWATSSHLNKLRDLIDWAHENDLEFHVTEASVWINGAHTEAAFEQQAETYRKIVDVLLEKRFTGQVGWNTWHIDDGHGWQTEKAPSLFDKSYQPKPAYYAVQDALENPPTEINDPSGKQEELYKLHENYPNPFNPWTIISFSVPKTTHVVVDVYNTMGQKVAGLVNEEKSAGTFNIVWDATSTWAHSLPSGVYFCRMRANDFIGVNKMILTR